MAGVGRCVLLAVVALAQECPPPLVEVGDGTCRELCPDWVVDEEAAELHNCGWIPLHSVVRAWFEACVRRFNRAARRRRGRPRDVRGRRGRARVPRERGICLVRIVGDVRPVLGDALRRAPRWSFGRGGGGGGGGGRAIGRADVGARGKGDGAEPSRVSQKVPQFDHADGRRDGRAPVPRLVLDLLLQAASSGEAANALRRGRVAFPVEVGRGRRRRRRVRLALGGRPRAGGVRSREHAAAQHGAGDGLIHL